MTTFKANSGLQDDGNNQGIFQQQFKNALHANSNQAIRNWVEKHFINMGTATLDEYISHALHAERVAKDKAKKKNTATTAGTYTVDYNSNDTDTQLYYQGGRRKRDFENRRRGRGKGPSRVTGNRRPNSWGPQRDSDVCWACGKKGHFARDCKKKDSTDPRGNWEA